MPGCSNCGKSVGDKVKICPHCGHRTRLNSPGMMGGGGLEYVIGFVVFGAVLFLILNPLIREAKHSAVIDRDYSQARQVALAFQAYSVDHDDRYPPIESNAEVAGLIDEYLAASDKDLHRYARTAMWNKDVALLKGSEIENISEVYLNWHIDSPETLNTMVTFVDGHTKHVSGVWDASKAAKPKMIKGNKPDF